MSAIPVIRKNAGKISIFIQRNTQMLRLKGEGQKVDRKYV